MMKAATGFGVLRLMDGWEFVYALEEQKAGDFVVDKAYLGEDDKYDYWR